MGIVSGFRSGVLGSISHNLGLLLGLVAGASLVPVVIFWGKFGSDSNPPLIAIISLVLFGSIGAAMGGWLGDLFRNLLTQKTNLIPIERVLGGLVSALVILLVVWVLGFAFRQTSSQPLRQLLQSSAILQLISTRMPAPPSFLTTIEESFAQLSPSTSNQPLEIPKSVNTAQVTAAANSVYRVEGRGCGGLVTGSAFAIGKHHLLTNAHVVAGTRNTRVIDDLHGTSYSASVVLFDPERDVAILYLPEHILASLPEGGGQRGTPGAVIGYPGGGNEQVEPAVIDSRTLAQGQNIYRIGSVNRDIWIVNSTVRPGNSGGPLVDLQGEVLGVVFAASNDNPNQAYALTDQEVAGDIQLGNTLTQPLAVSAESCAA